MADPLTCIGAAASIAGIIDVLSRSITFGSRLTEQWNDSQLAFTGLQTQLQAMRSALEQIRVWIESSEASDIHHQLTMDLDSIILCCKSLVSRLDSHLGSLAHDSSGQLKRLGKLRLLIGGRNINEIQKMVEKQVGALNLLLLACNCNALLEQKKLLEQKSTRAVFRKVEQESASLIVLRDTSSYRSAITDTLSRLSWVFGFDEELSNSKVYSRAWRNNLRKARQLEEAVKIFPRSLEEHQEGKKPENREVNVILLGTSDTSKTTLFKQMRAICEEKDLPEEARNDFKPIIFNTMCELVGELEDRAEESEDIVFSPEVQGYMKALRYGWSALGGFRPSNALPREALRPLSKLWYNEEWRETLSKFPDISIHFSYFMANLDRIFSPSYVPNHDDMLNAKVWTTGIFEEVLDFDGCAYRFSDVGGAQSQRKKWSHLWENREVDIVLFHVSLGTYDQSLREGKENQLVDALLTFESIIKSGHLTNSTMLLVFTKMDVFERKLLLGRTTPPKESFPYNGDYTDVLAVRDMITKRFTDVGEAEKDFIITCLDARNTEQARKLLQKIHTCAKQRLQTSGASVGRAQAETL